MNSTMTDAARTNVPSVGVPPVYSTEDPNPVAASALELSNAANLEPPFLKAGEVWELGHTTEKGHTGYEIKRNDDTLYYVAHYHSQDQPDVVVYGGYNSTGPRLAQASFMRYTKDFKIYIGDQKTPAEEAEYDMVTCEGGGLFSNAAYRFDPRRTTDKLYWKKTSDRKLGASIFSPRDVKLVDANNEDVVAAYIEHGSGSQFMYGSIKFYRGIRESSALAALTVLMSLLERFRRAAKLGARANARKVTR